MKRLFFALFILGASAILVQAQTESAGGGQVTIETALCTGIQDRMPVGQADIFPADVGKVYLWCHVIGSSDTTMIKHVWYYQGEEIVSVQLPVRSSSWRTHSYKTIAPEWTGDWAVKVLDNSGNVLKAVSFKIEVGAAAPIESQPAVETPVTPPAEEKAPADTGQAENPSEPK